MTSATKFKTKLVALLATLPDYLLKSIEESPRIFATSLGFSETVDTLPSGARFSLVKVNRVLTDFGDLSVSFLDNEFVFSVAPATCVAPNLEGESAGTRLVRVLPYASADCEELDSLAVRDAGRLIELAVSLENFFLCRYGDGNSLGGSPAVGRAPEGLDAATTIRAAISSLRIRRSIEASAAAARAAISARAAEVRAAL